MKLVLFDPEHVTRIKLQPRQCEMFGNMTLDYARGLSAMGPALSGIHDGEVIFCGGCAKLWEGRIMLWSLLSLESGKHMLTIVKAAKRMLAVQDGRVEAAVVSDYEEAHRLVKACGLTWHHREEQFYPGKVDADVYVRFC
jgi:hypothetical protein